MGDWGGGGGGGEFHLSEKVAIPVEKSIPTSRWQKVTLLVDHRFHSQTSRNVSAVHEALTYFKNSIT